MTRGARIVEHDLIIRSAPDHQDSIIQLMLCLASAGVGNFQYGHNNRKFRATDSTRFTAFQPSESSNRCRPDLNCFSLTRAFTPGTRKAVIFKSPINVALMAPAFFPRRKCPG